MMGRVCVKLRLMREPIDHGNWSPEVAPVSLPARLIECIRSFPWRSRGNPPLPPPWGGTQAVPTSAWDGGAPCTCHAQGFPGWRLPEPLPPRKPHPGNGNSAPGLSPSPRNSLEGLHCPFTLWFTNRASGTHEGNQL